MFEPVLYRSVAQITGQTIDIDYEHDLKIVPGTETGSEQKLQSKRLVAASDSFSCERSNATFVSMYGYAFKNTFLTRERLDFTTALTMANVSRKTISRKSSSCASF